MCVIVQLLIDHEWLSLMAFKEPLPFSGLVLSCCLPDIGGHFGRTLLTRIQIRQPWYFHPSCDKSSIIQWICRLSTLLSVTWGHQQGFNKRRMWKHLKPLVYSTVYDFYTVRDSETSSAVFSSSLQPGHTCHRESAFCLSLCTVHIMDQMQDQNIKHYYLLEGLYVQFNHAFI